MSGQQGSRDWTPSRRRRQVLAGIGIGTLAVAATGCGPSISLMTAPWSESQAVIQSAVFGEKNLTFDKPPVITVENGRIDSVKVSGPDGERVDGELVDGGTGWKVDTTDLDFGKKYTVSATAVDLRGNETSANESFRTFVPEKELEATTNLVKGEVYGVAMPIIVTFNLPVKDKAAIEEHLLVTTDDGQPVEGAWNWDSDTSVTYRPKEYWPANTKVTLDAEIKGVNAGDQQYSLKNKTETFKIGDKFEIVQDSGKHKMTVYRNDKKLRVMPTSTGKPGHETRSGNKVIMSKEYHVVMDSATVGVPEGSPDYYRLDVYYAMRVTWSGEYIHSAPWSVGSQGYSNVSHGCINVGPDNAIWLYNNAKVGDPVKVKNTGVEQDLGNGWTMWEESWDEWQKGSALKS